MKKRPSLYSIEEAFERLCEGNRRFVQGIRHSPLDSHLYRWQHHEFIQEQRPFAVILGCSDSRVPAEIIFDQGIGDLFVVRVAGNIVAPSQVCSIEFAVERFGICLVVVLGHSHCGIVQETLNILQQQPNSYPPYLDVLIKRIRPSIEPLLKNKYSLDDNQLLYDAIHANIHHSMDQLLSNSTFLHKLNDKADLRIVGAEYSLETGQVSFFSKISH